MSNGTPSRFAHLHTHSEYSLLDGLSTIEKLIQAARADQQPALAITDHGNLFGAVEFYILSKKLNEKAKKDGLPEVKPIIGMEAYITPIGKTLDWRPPSYQSRDSNDGLYEPGSYHLILLAENETGWRNMMKLASIAYLDGHYRKPRIDHDTLARHASGLIMTSTDIGGELAQAILTKGLDAARQVAGHYMDVIGRDNYYFEVQDHSNGQPLDAHFLEDHLDLSRREKAVNEAVLQLAREFNRPVVATNDSHYLKRQDAEAHDILLCISTRKQKADEKRLRFPSDDFFFRSCREMHEVFDSWAPDAVDNTMLIAERCNLEMHTTIDKKGTDGYFMPQVDVPSGVNPDQYFRDVVYRGLKGRYGDPLPEKVVARAEEELKHIIALGFTGYLLLVYDIVRTARDMKIPVGPGRGSAAGSITCFALGITNIDPLPYDLLFERFINPGRNEMPDIDIDFCQARRQELLDRIVEKYGRENVANIITFGTLGPKMAIRDVSRVLGIELSTADRWAKLIPDGPNQTLEDQEKTNADIQALYNDPKNEDFKKVWNTAKMLEGTSRNSGVHAAGIVISPRPVVEFAALYKDPKTQTVTTQNHKKLIDPIGLLKIDFLGLQTLTSINRTLELIETRRGVRLPLDEIPQLPVPDYEAMDAAARHPLFPLDNIKKTYQMLAKGQSTGLFQFESDGMKRLLRQAKPDRLDDLIALNAMYRPGPMKNIDSFIQRKHGKEPIVYLHPNLEPLLNSTYGIIVYQEQVMLISNVLAGFTLSEADRLRKAMGGKDLALMKHYKDKFIEGAVANGVSRDAATGIGDIIEEFAKYGFNKSHSTAYAFIALQTAYLKANYPAEFMASQITLDKGDSDKVLALIEDSRVLGLDVLPPCVNKSDVDFLPESDSAIRFGLGAIKGCGSDAMTQVVAARGQTPFKDIFDFCERVDFRSTTQKKSSMNKKALEALVKAGAFDFFTENRAQLLDIIPQATQSGAVSQRERDRGQLSLFGAQPEPVNAKSLLKDIPDMPSLERAREEKSAIGFYMTSHPLKDYRRVFDQLTTLRSDKIGNAPSGLPAVIGGLIVSVRTVMTKRNEKMAFVTIEDRHGICEATFFPGAYEKTYVAVKSADGNAERESVLKSDNLVFIVGRIEEDNRDPEAVKKLLNGQQAFLFDDAFKTLPLDVRLEARAGEITLDRIERLNAALNKSAGRSNVFITLRGTAVGDVYLSAGGKRRITPGPAFQSEIKSIFDGADIMNLHIDASRLEGMLEPVKRRFNRTGEGSGRERY
ncbi:MAG: DNA polymerase III subunit alpha [Planctomycetota bacterium]